MSFDFLADWEQQFQQPRNSWHLDVTLGRARINATGVDPSSPKALISELTKVRGEFLARHGFDTNGRREPKGPAKRLTTTPSVDPVFRTHEIPGAEALNAFPKYSARLLLEFQLDTPLLTRDDDPFYLFDNPARKDHILGAPYLAAATLAGLAGDAYQRAFPAAAEWPGRTPFRAQDPHAKRLFGIAPDGGPKDTTEAEQGRLHFSPVWFQAIQYLVLNPGDEQRGIGTLPIQFEAIAPETTGILELRYCNPRGADASEEGDVRADLARLLGALAQWWPALGLGAKRLAGYGGITPRAATLQAKDWTGLEPQAPTPPAAERTTPTVPEPPSYYSEYLDADGRPNEAIYEKKVAEQRGLKDQEIRGLEDKKQGLDPGKRDYKKKLSKLDKQLQKAREQRNQIEQEQANRFKKVQEYYATHGHAMGASTAAAEARDDVREPAPIGEHRREGPDSWWELACWIDPEDA